MNNICGKNAQIVFRQTKIKHYKGTVSVISRDPPCKEDNFRIHFKPLTDLCDPCVFFIMMINLPENRSVRLRTFWNTKRYTNDPCPTLFSKI